MSAPASITPPLAGAEPPSEWPRGGTRAEARPPGEPRRVGYLYLLPAFAAFAAFVLAPLGHAFWISLWEWDGITPATWVGLGNYGDVVSDPVLRRAFLHAVVLLLFYAVLPVAI